MNKKIAMLLALNDKFVLSMKVFLISLKESNPWFNEDIILLSDGNLSEKNVLALKKIYENIIVITAKKDDYKRCLPTTQKWGYNLYYRFDIFDMGNLGYDRIIIFDSDMVFLNNIKELWEDTHSFSACEKYLGIPEIEPDNLVEQGRKRFNCGLMSFAVTMLKPEHKHNLIKLATERSWSSDQPVFNVYFANSVYYLPQKYNVVSSIASIPSLKEAHIIQYHGFVKPWHSDNAEECFEEFVKDEIDKNVTSSKLIIKKLKYIFDSYVQKAKLYE